MSVEAAVRTFWSSPRFAVAGASSDPSKFGHKVLLWYVSHGLPITPINPSCATISFPPSRKLSSMPTQPSPLALGEAARQTALSVITPPAVTRKVLAEAKEAGIRAVWLQPGSFDKEGLAYAKREWPQATVAGFEKDDSGFGTRGGEGWCVLVDGDAGLKLVGKREERL